MYDNTATWNPFKGCRFNCEYCKPSFQRQSKRWGKNNCDECYNFVPHKHPERLDTSSIPSEDIIFVCGSGDISFTTVDYIRKIIDVIKEHNERCPDKTYYFQTKRPSVFNLFVDELPDNAVILTTIETNRKELSEEVSDAPSVVQRYMRFKDVDYDRKVLTIEPIMDFDLKPLINYILSIDLENVWIGYNSRPSEIELTEPSERKVKKLLEELDGRVEVKTKELRSINF